MGNVWLSCIVVLVPKTLELSLDLRWIKRIAIMFWRDVTRLDNFDCDLISYCDLGHRPIEMLARCAIDSPNATRKASVRAGFPKDPCQTRYKNTIIANPDRE